ncbi:MAG: hypothetical protein A2493_00385 [Candidatus Magasanikbacteria bacterium RIFOXYC12_FULL_33_11]|uniref:Uncharacterized protein n=1 Tax=Candidatus Magasanikbacteria bacterium RIFOXYC12_FULL_33_11 TaxID=1798701 RepID=A0A1F6NLP2_9BACT|nr:MAG: hypothetical protein A2493_00385 [Candidatus Magasanikbacteria bacterium RIFOXYC12_FULL_33_11]
MKNKTKIIALFSISVIFLFFFWEFITNSFLVPLDGLDYDARLATNTNQDINNYFETGAGQYLPTTILMIISLSILFFKIRKKEKDEKYNMIEFLGVSNILYIFSVFSLLVFSLILLPEKDFEPGYNIPAIVINSCFILLLFLFQILYKNNFEKISVFFKKLFSNLLLGIIFSYIFLLLLFFVFRINALENNFNLKWLFLIPGIGVIINNMISKEKQQKLQKTNIMVILGLCLTILLFFGITDINNIVLAPVFLVLSFSYSILITLVLTVILNLINWKKLFKNKK